MRQTRDWHSFTCLIENFGKYPFAKEIGLISAACWVIRDVQPHLQNIAGRNTVAFDGRAEDCFWVLGNSHEYIRFTTADFQCQTEFPECFLVDSLDVEVRLDTVNELEAQDMRQNFAQLARAANSRAAFS